MKRRTPSRILSLFLALVLLFTSCPPVYAAEMQKADTVALEETAAIEQEEPTIEGLAPVPEEETEVQTEAAETESLPEETVTEPTEQTTQTEPAESTEATVPGESTEATVPEETTEETVPEETTEETIPEETVEETLPEELPWNFPGLPEEYVLSEEALIKKQTLREMGVADTLKNLTPGEDFREGQIVVAAESQEDAEIIAAAFGGELTDFQEDSALIALTEHSVAEAVEASLDPDMPLPAAEANYIVRIEPPVVPDSLSLAAILPERRSWQTWIQDVGINDPALQYPDGSNYQWMHDAVDTYAAWGVTTGESWVKVAVIDTGVQNDHPELNGRVSTRQVNGLGTSDVAGHGTAVAGVIAAALDNGVGGAGIAPGVSIMSYRVCEDNGDIYTSDLTRAIIQAADDGAHIINMSLGGPAYTYETQEAINYAVSKGVTVIAATGNEGTNVMEYPAAYDGVIAVAATTSGGVRADFSTYGPWTDVSAPGQSIYTTAYNSGDGIVDGTSFSAPVVAGVAALYTSARGGRVAPAEMEAALKKAATKLKDSGMGAGQVNAANLFGAKPAAPFCFVSYDYDYSNRYDMKFPVPCDSTLYFAESEELAKAGKYGDMNDVLLVTLDGKTPSVKNGQVVNGQVVREPAYLELSGYAGETLTIKAARMSGMGVLGAVMTVKLKVARSAGIEGVTIHGSTKVLPGKSTTYTAKVSPEGTADQTVLWEITDASNALYGAKISKTGKLTTPAGKTGWVTIRATSQANPWVYGELTVNVENARPAKTLRLNHSDGYVYVDDVFTLVLESMTDAYGSAMNASQVGYRFTSSNPKVATIDPQTGLVTAYAKGNTVLTCTALDGSNAKATCKLEVRQRVEQVVITGNDSMTPGTSFTYKATVLPSTANAKKVTWMLKDDVTGISIDPKSGKVSVASWASTGTSFTIVALAQDDFGAYATKTVSVRRKCSAVYIGTEDSAGLAPGATFKRDGFVQSITLFSVDLPDSTGEDNSIQLDAWYRGPDEDVPMRWSSSNPAVASISWDGRVTAHKAGSATITLQATDGSNKKASCSVKVVNPVSSLTINPGTNMANNYEFNRVACGKSAKNTVSFANTYGVPSNKKVAWDFCVYEVDSSGNRTNWTYTFKNQKLITISNGTLSVKAGVEQYWANIDGEFLIEVTAKALDGTNATAYCYYYISRSTRNMYMDSYSKTLTVPSDRVGYAYFWCDQWRPFAQPGTYALEATSSNPKVAGVLSIEPDSDYWYKITFATGKPGTKGSATITIKSNDGTNKKCSFTVKVPK